MSSSHTPDRLPPTTVPESPLHEAILPYENDNPEYDEIPANAIVSDVCKNIIYEIGPFVAEYVDPSDKDFSTRAGQEVEGGGKLSLALEGLPVFDSIIRKRYEGQRYINPAELRQCAEAIWKNYDAMAPNESPLLHLELLHGRWSLAGAALKNISQDKTLHVFTLSERIVEPNIDIEDRDNTMQLVEKVKEHMKDGEFPYRFGSISGNGSQIRRHIETFLEYEEVKKFLDAAVVRFYREGYRLRNLADQVDPTLEIEAILQENKVVGLLVIKQIKVTKYNREKGNSWNEWDKGAGQ